MSIKSRIAAILTAAGLAVAGLSLLAPTTASAADSWDDAKCEIDSYTPHSVTVGLSPVARTFNVNTSVCEYPEGWNLSTADYLFYVYDDNAKETFNPYGLSNSDAGRHDVMASAYNGAYDETSEIYYGGFTLKRNTYWQANSFNASPEPVKTGRTVTVKGRLKVADWDNMVYKGFGKRPVKVQFKAKGSSTWTTVKNTTTGSDGWFKTTTTATKSGTYRADFSTTQTFGAATSGGDYVSVYS